jgi:hypothetical protein
MLITISCIHVGMQVPLDGLAEAITARNKYEFNALGAHARTHPVVKIGLYLRTQST